MPQYTLNGTATTAVTTFTYSIDSAALGSGSGSITNDVSIPRFFYLDQGTSATNWTVVTASTPATWEWNGTATATAAITDSSNWYTYPVIPVPPMTPEEREARRVRVAAVKEAEDTARARAEVLLNRYLRDDQRVTLREKGWFMVVSRTGNRYRVYRGRSHNVKLLDSFDREVATYCAHPQMVVPEADCMLSQKLMLELAEDRFLAMANKRHLMSNIMPERRLAA